MLRYPWHPIDEIDWNGFILIEAIALGLDHVPFHQSKSHQNSMLTFTSR
jgi:hypothetical protein